MCRKKHSIYSVLFGVSGIHWVSLNVTPVDKGRLLIIWFRKLNALMLPALSAWTTSVSCYTLQSCFSFESPAIIPLTKLSNLPTLVFMKELPISWRWYLLYLSSPVVLLFADMPPSPHMPSVLYLNSSSLLAFRPLIL